MANTHFSGPLVVGGKQLTDNTTIAPLAQEVTVTYVAAESQAISDKVDAIIATLIAAGGIKSS